VTDNFDALVNGIAREARAGDHILVMSNGGFAGIHDKLLAALRATEWANPPDDPGI
jgi:UDP-N-acetylmuramate: L-alanyl-gamma-D-glutamyl-meso-diaminopimelate ligase